MANRAVVSAIIERKELEQRLVYVQTRWKPKSSPTYSGLLEIPAGGINDFEHVSEALSREVFEETGLKVVKINGGFVGDIQENIPGSRAIVFQPYVCQQVLMGQGALSWLGFVFRCEVEGNVVVNDKEAKDPQWISLTDLKKQLKEKPESFFPLQYPVLKYYVENS